MFQKTIFKKTTSFQTLYVSSDGLLLSSRGGINKIKPSYVDRDGYLRFMTTEAGVERNGKVHRAVLEAWCGPCPDGMQARHLDGNKLNNSISNLKWGTANENGKDRTMHRSTHGSKNHRSKLTEGDVLMLREQFKDKSLTALTRENPKWSKFAIWAAITGYSWAHLPNAAKTNRRCTKEGWRQGVKLR